MIVSFSVSNFRSFSTEETFSLVASNRVSNHPDHAIRIPGSKEKVLRTAVLYGANGAGKSNLFIALRYVESIALKSRAKNTGTERQPFRFGNSPEAPSSFDLQFISAKKLYRFGFKVDDDRIVQEWLFQVVGAKQKVLYERTTDEKGQVVIRLDGLKDAGRKIHALALVGGPQNQSFLATVNVNLEISDMGEELNNVLRWFNRSLSLVGPDEYYGRLAHLLEQDPTFESFAGSFLKATSTGVDHLEIVKKELSKEELRALLPNDLVSKMLRDLDEGARGVGVVSLEAGKEVVIERKGKNRDGHFYHISIQAAHEHEPGTIVKLELDEESDGTRRLLNLLPALYHLRTTPAVYVIDEIDRSLHPILVKEFLEFFLKSCDPGLRQIIVTTHESNLLDQDLLRRDEIWFVEKDATAATRLYSLIDFKVRNDLQIRKHYLQGRFGAVPFLGSLDQLLNRTDPRQ